MKSEYQRPIQLELPFDLEATAEAMRQEDAEHGDIEDNFATIASYWSEHLGTEVTSVDVAVMMALLKLARIKTNAVNRDNWIDGCGYLACGGELVDRKLKSELEGLDRGG